MQINPTYFYDSRNVFTHTNGCLTIKPITHTNPYYHVSSRIAISDIRIFTLFPMGKSISDIWNWVYIWNWNFQNETMGGFRYLKLQFLISESWQLNFKMDCHSIAFAVPMLCKQLIQKVNHLLLVHYLHRQKIWFTLHFRIKIYIYL